MTRMHVCVMIVTVNSISCVLSDTASGLNMLPVRALRMLHTYVINHHMHIYKYVLTYSGTARSRFLLGKQTDFQLVKKFPAFYGTRRLITAFTSALQLFLS